MGLLSEARYRKLAKEKYQDEGTLEIDASAVVSNGDDNGAYVQAWVWVADPSPDHDHEEPVAPEDVNDHLRNDHDWDLTYSESEAVETHNQVHEDENG